MLARGQAGAGSVLKDSRNPMVVGADVRRAGFRGQDT